LAVHERMPAPFERARTLLIYGTILRRAKRRKAAREAIEEALSIFEALPAPVWAANSRAELARIGGRPPSSAGLTEGERRIAELRLTAARAALSGGAIIGALTAETASAAGRWCSPAAAAVPPAPGSCLRARRPAPSGQKRRRGCPSPPRLVPA